MAQSPFEHTKFRWCFSAAWLLLLTAYTPVIHAIYGTGWYASGADSLITFLVLLPVIGLCLLMPGYYLPGKFWYIYVPVISALFACFTAWLSQIISGYFFPEAIPQTGFFALRWFTGFILLMGVFTGSVLWVRSGEKADAGKRQAELNEKMRDAELHKLQHQLQPHFLFNSLNSINALVQVDPDQAQNMVQKLSDFLRFTLRRADEQWVSVEHEMEYLNLYLEIEKIRFRHRLDLQVNIQPETQAQKLPTLILQPIVENAIKFGLYGTTGRVSISLNAVMEKSRVKITVTNPFDTEMLASNGGTGFGLKAVRRRLQLLYNRNDLLLTGHHENIYTTTVIIPIRPL